MGFKEDFLWGGGVSAVQCEGSFEGDGKGRAIREPENFHEPAVDFYHHYPEDIKLFEELGMKAFRTSIDWSRLYPDPWGELNQTGVAYYRDMFEKLREAGITPIVTLSHGGDPYPLKKIGEWSSKETIDLFMKYVKTCYEKFGDLIPYWLTFNEVNCGPAVAGRGFGGEPPQPYDFVYNGLHNRLVASAKATILLHEMYPESKMGNMLGYFAIYPKTCNPKDNIKCMQKTNILHHICGEVQVYGEYPYFVKRFFAEHAVHLNMTEEEKEILKKGTVDFVSISYYCSDVISHLEDRPIVSGNLVGGVDNEFLQKNGWGWHIDPEGFRWVLNDCYQRYKKPIAVVENGLGSFDEVVDGKIHDDYRIEFLKDNIGQMKEAVEDGVDVFAYCMWSPIDIVAASVKTVKKRYGVIYVDVDDEGNGTFNRIKKDSFDYYKHVIETNGEEL